MDAVGIFETAFAKENDLKLRVNSEGGAKSGESSTDDENVGKKVRMPLRMKRDKITHK
jgi:hypothetical protein